MSKQSASTESRSTPTPKAGGESTSVVVDLASGCDRNGCAVCPEDMLCDDGMARIARALAQAHAEGRAEGLSEAAQICDAVGAASRYTRASTAEEIGDAIRALATKARGGEG